jgi:hypothetical protein
MLEVVGLDESIVFEGDQGARRGARQGGQCFEGRLYPIELWLT